MDRLRRGPRGHRAHPRPRTGADRRRGVNAPALALLLAAPRAAALVLLGAGPNTSPPDGDLAGSGWQFIGRFTSGGAAGFAATAVGPRHVLTARHLGFAAGDGFVFGGAAFMVTARTNLPGSDLALGRVSARLPAWAPLHGTADETGRAAMLFGPGLVKGAEVRDDLGRLRGWEWTAPAAAGLRWGTNTVARVQTQADFFRYGEAVTLLTGDFLEGGGPALATYAFGDSGAPLFLRGADGRWRVAGVASAVDGPFARSAAAADAAFNAALFDAGGFWLVESPTQRSPIPRRPGGNPASWYAGRVSEHLAALRAVIADTETTVRVAGAAVQGTFPGAAGALHCVERAESPAGPWAVLAEAVADDAGVVAWSDTADAAARFYRARRKEGP